MTDKNIDVSGAGTVLRGNFTPTGATNPDLQAVSVEKSAVTRATEEFEKAARERIGGSIAFVTRLKDPKKDVLFFEGDD